MNHNQSVKLAILIAFAVEFSLLTFGNNILGPFISPLVFSLASISVGFLTLWIAGNPLSFSKAMPISTFPGNNKAWLIAGVILSLVLIGLKLNSILIRSPIDAYDTSQSDIIPQIKFLVKRYLDGQFPYQVIDDWKQSIFPTYLPLQWMPFCIAEWLSMDYRWIPFISLGIVLLLFVNQTHRATIKGWEKRVIAFLPLLCWYFLLEYDEFTFSITVEQLIAGYYLFFALGISKENKYWMGIGLMLCLLSRYAVVLWIPLLIVIELLANPRNLYWVLGIPLAGFAVFYLPFLIEDPSIFQKGYQYHTEAAIGEWTRPEGPIHLYSGLGLAIYFYQFVEGTVTHKIEMLQHTHLIVLILSTLFFMVYYYLKRSKLNSSIFLLGSLKVYMALFYAFIQIPYWYLFIVPFFLTFVCLYKVSSVNVI